MHSFLNVSIVYFVMNKKNTKKLLKDFPNLYKQYYDDMTQTCMCWGFDIGPGWFDLIYDLSKQLQEVAPDCEASQVKQKWGGLRFYVDNCNEAGHDLISKAEEESYKICEECGASGSLREDLPFVQTLCDEHYDDKKDVLKKWKAKRK